ncbi:MAG: hypothetical protein MMC33_008707 [Icmadophila ericetorum]|nr:hypothetical protein [Icmadophila ericetorum]
MAAFQASLGSYVCLSGFSPGSRACDSDSINGDDKTIPEEIDSFHKENALKLLRALDEELQNAIFLLKDIPRPSTADKEEMRHVKNLIEDMVADLMELPRRSRVREASEGRGDAGGGIGAFKVGLVARSMDALVEEWVSW